jgi:hypothetical protein
LPLGVGQTDPLACSLLLTHVYWLLLHTGLQAI